MAREPIAPDESVNPEPPPNMQESRKDHFTK
jgi:hypothetical protein